MDECAANTSLLYISPEWPDTLLGAADRENQQLVCHELCYFGGSDMEGQCSAVPQNWQSSSNMEFCCFLPFFCC